MHKVKAIFKHIWPILVVLILVIIVIPKDPPPSATVGPSSGATAGKYTAEQIMELARSLSPDCRMQKAPEPGGLG